MVDKLLKILSEYLYKKGKLPKDFKIEYVEDTYGDYFKFDIDLSKIFFHIPIIEYELWIVNYYLKGIVFTAALREILLRYIIESDRFSECKIKKEYEKHFIELMSEEFPKKFENSDNKIIEWIKRAVARFSDYEIKKGKSLIAIMPSSEINISEKLTYKK